MTKYLKDVETQHVFKVIYSNVLVGLAHTSKPGVER
jgi:hypothetical protein